MDTKQFMNQMIINGMGIDVGDFQFYAGIGLMVQAIIVTMILANTVEYYENFHKSDNPYVQYAVGAGSLLCCGTLFLSGFQFYNLTHRMDDFATVIRIDTLCNFAYGLLGGVFSLVATSFYSVRIYRISGRRWWTIPPLALCVVASFSVMLVLISKGLSFPVIDLSSALKLEVFYRDLSKRWKAYSAVTMTCDAIISLSMIYLLTRSRNHIFGKSSDGGIVRKINLIILESMLPPTIVVAILLIGDITGMTGAIAGFFRIPTCALSILYYNSLLYSLVGRKKIRDLLDQTPIAKYRHNPSDPSSSGKTPSDPESLALSDYSYSANAPLREVKPAILPYHMTGQDRDRGIWVTRAQFSDRSGGALSPPPRRPGLNRSSTAGAADSTVREWHERNRRNSHEVNDKDLPALPEVRVSRFEPRISPSLA